MTEQLTKRPKTGQHIDLLKRELINPLLTDTIQADLGRKKSLSMADLGTGDATAALNLAERLTGKGIGIKNLGLLDIDREIFPDLALQVAEKSWTLAEQTQLAMTEDWQERVAFTRRFEGKYDYALAQLVLHQIDKEYEATYLLANALRLLKPGGVLGVVDFHPRYLRHVAKTEPGKFEIEEDEDQRISGTYHFDSSGSAPVYNLDIKNQAARLLGLGFDTLKLTTIHTATVAEAKPRYRRLAEEETPMFYLLETRRSDAHFVSATDGVVDRIKSHGSRWMEVRFAYSDGDEIRIPKFRDWQTVSRGDYLSLHEVVRPEPPGRTYLNYWVISPDNKLRGGQLAITSF